MKVKLLLFAGLRERAGSSELSLDGLSEGLDVAGLKRELIARFPRVERLDAVRAAVADRYVDDATPLKDGDVVALIPPVSGGAPGRDDELERGVFELLATPLDAADCQARVADASCGAIAAFTGVTRDRNRGQRVIRLEYEAFASMTRAEMERIFARCRELHGDPDGSRPERRLRMLCRHRVGVVAVGEPSVVIAVASPHRAQAFDACRFLIDELKRSVPIWKKELYEGGEHWVGERS